MSRQHTYGNDVNSRITGVEHEVTALKTDLAGVKSDVSFIRSQLEAIGQAIQQAAAGSKTNWGTLAGWAAVIISIMVYHNSLALDPIKDALISGKEANISQYQRINKLEEEICKLQIEYSYLRGIMEMKEKQMSHE